MSDITKNSGAPVGSTIEQDLAFDNKINQFGRWSSVLALVSMCVVPIAISLAYRIDINFGEVVAVGGSLIAMFAPMAIVENISYYAIIGAGGVYLSSITGNIMNMKLPCALSGMQIADVEPGSKQGDIISILCIGVSSIVTSVLIFLGMLVIGKFLLPLLTHPVLKPGFDNIMPALMGAVAVPLFLRNTKIAATPIVISLILCIVVGSKVVQRYQSYFLPVLMTLSVLAAYLMYKKGMLEKK